MTISELLIVNHTHTDIGYTDHAETLFRHHNSIIDDALDVVENYKDRPNDSRFRWTCETSMITANWFRQASTFDQDRFRDFYDQGLIGVGAMPLVWTPLISPANAVKSLKHVHFLRNEGVNPTVAIQSDVNGLAWHWTDLLLNIGVDSYFTQPNPHRGAPFNENQRIFDWQAPSGNKLFTVHGWHYSVGVVSFFFGDDNLDKTQERIDRVISQLEARKQFPYKKAILPITNQASVDNGFASKGIPEFVEKWNTENRLPKLSIVTIEQAIGALKHEVAASPDPLPVHRGDWSDYWVDGVGSTAYETAIARTAERLLPVVDTLAAFTKNGDTEVLDLAEKEIQIYDEHTWGSFCAATKPESSFTRFSEMSKRGRAHLGFATALEAVQTEGKRRAREVTDDLVEGDLQIRRHDFGVDNSAAPKVRPTPTEQQSYYVMNPTSFARKVTWPVVFDTMGSQPQTILDSHLCDHFMTGMELGDEDDKQNCSHIISVDLPPFGEAVVKPVPVKHAAGINMAENWIENEHYKLVIDLSNGSLSSLLDKASVQDFANTSAPSGLAVYETLADPKKDRRDIFGDLKKWDWTRLETLVWPKDPGYEAHLADKVRLEKAKITSMGVELTVGLLWNHGDEMKITYRLPHEGGGVDVDTLITKQSVTSPESFYISFGIPGEYTVIELDVGDHQIEPGAGQIPTSCKEWVSVQEFATVSTDAGALVVVPLDSPLVQPFGIQTPNAGHGTVGRDPSLAFWTLNNHWDTNFAIQQSGGIHARFRLLPQTAIDLKEARRFAKVASTPPVIVRAYDSSLRPASQLVSIKGSKNVIVRVRKGWEGNTVIATVVNPTNEHEQIELSLPQHKIATADIVSALEVKLLDCPFETDGDKFVKLDMKPGETKYVRFSLG